MQLQLTSSPSKDYCVLPVHPCMCVCVCVYVCAGAVDATFPGTCTAARSAAMCAECPC
jgi:hypothetical protein